MGFVHRAFVAAGVGFAVSAIAGCGSSGGRWLSQSEASRLSGQLNQVQVALDAGQCTRAQQYLSDFQNTLSQFSGVNSTLIANLNQGASTIASLTSNQCATRTVTTPKHRVTRTHTSTSTTTTGTVSIPTFTEPTTTTTYTTPTYTTPTVTTSTTGGQGIGTTTTATDTSTTGTGTGTTPGSGGTGLSGTDTSTTGNTTTTSGNGF